MTATAETNELFVSKIDFGRKQGEGGLRLRPNKARTKPNTY